MAEPSELTFAFTAGDQSSNPGRVQIRYYVRNNLGISKLIAILKRVDVRLAAVRESEIDILTSEDYK